MPEIPVIEGLFRFVAFAPDIGSRAIATMSQITSSRF